MYSNIAIRTAIFCILVMGLAPDAIFAELISHSTSGEISANFDGTELTDASVADMEILNALAAGNNSETETDLQWEFDGDCLTGSGNMRAEKLVSARPGGEHISTMALSLEFTIDQPADFTVDGSWSFAGADPAGDSLAWQILDSSGTVASATEGTDPFSANGQLQPGTYTFVISGTLTETINNQGAATGQFNLDGFCLEHIAVPEPSVLIPCIGALLVMSSRRRKIR